MKKILTPLLLTFSAALILGCETETSIEENTVVKENSAKRTNPNDNNILELAPGDIAPAFTRETVIKLNAIVSKQLEVVTEFDRIKRLHQKSESASEKDISEYESVVSDLLAQAKANDKEMMEAKTALLESGENYNAPTLAGMVDFIKDVEQEIASYHAILGDSTLSTVAR